MGKHSEKFTNCVCDTLLSIVEAQDQVENDCQFSCDTAIQELVGGASSPYNTIPVMLTCKGTCELFVGHGVRRSDETDTELDVINSIVFRVNDVDPETCCATLELLQEADTRNRGDLLKKIEHADLEATNVCITVDLKCFCAVTCLPPVNL
ncbi:CotY/CotZ family spore coat protein [Fervidibacillus halotolerans]|uniref:CotY/CotZ family spore coat protein n=1 Tax=Fervidibacillus halotolerans TaxID=2980027 RepID=A0A9E8RYQ9_9BACI|nr:CotY/CotZ family spore coat protein [Fervidibacillus halotolerans]WAA13081.1 CotY/CotZ family spore coat protein [Fervidibacillus halotolerans]